MVKTKSIGFFIALLIAPLMSQGKSVRMSSSETAKLCDSQRPNPTTKLKSDLQNISAAVEESFNVSGYNSCNGKQKGIASVYGLRGRDNFAGKRTASGEIMRPEKYRAAILRSASRQYPLGTWVRVTSGDRSVLVCINDTGGGKRGRVIDLSAAASRALGGDDLTHVEVECILKPTDGQSRCDDKVATQISQNDL